MSWVILFQLLTRLNFPPTKSIEQYDLYVGSHIFQIMEPAILTVGTLAYGGYRIYKDGFLPKESSGMYKRKRGSSSMMRRNVRTRRKAPTRAPYAAKSGRNFASATKKTAYYSNLGVKPGSHATKKHTRKTPVTNSAEDKKLHTIRLMKIPFSDADTDMSSREHRLVNVKGVSVTKWISFKGPTSNGDLPLNIRWAVLNPKQNNGITANIDEVDFFMSKNPTTETTTNFIPGSQDWYDLMTRAINKRKYGVIKEGFFTLNPAETSQNDVRKTARQQKLIKLYLPVNRQVKWASNGTTDNEGFPDANMFFVWWYCARGDLGQAQKYVGTNDVPLETSAEITTYFRTAAPHT